MGTAEKIEVMTPEAVRAKEEYLFSTGAEKQKEIEELKAPVLFADQYGDQYIYCNGKYERVEQRKPGKIIMAEPFETFSLDGLIDYIKADPEGLFNQGGRNIVRVKSPTLVEVIAPQRGYWRERELMAYCKALVPEISFGRYMDTDQFQIMVQTSFVESENRALVLQVAGSVRKERRGRGSEE